MGAERVPEHGEPKKFLRRKGCGLIACCLQRNEEVSACPVVHKEAKDDPIPLPTETSLVMTSEKPYI